MSSERTMGAIIGEVKDEQANQSCETEIYVDYAEETQQEPEPTCPETSIGPQFVIPIHKTQIKALAKPGSKEATNTLVVNSKFHKNAEDLEMNCADCGLRLAKVARVHHAKVCRKTPVCLYCAATFTTIAALEEHKPACKEANWQDHTVRLLQHEIHVPDNRLQMVPESQLKRNEGLKDDVNVDIKIRRKTIRCIQPESVKRGIIFHVCMKCDQQFSTPQELGVHKQDPENCQRFTLQRNRPGFRQGGRFCRTCMKHFPNHQLFTAHASTCKSASRDKMAEETGSTSKMMHNCFVCYKGFDSADELKRHRQQWHLTAKGDTSNCWVCGNMFKSFKELMAHHEEAHKDLAEEPKPKRMRPAPDQSHLVLTSGSELNIEQPKGDLEASELVNETLAMLSQMQQDNSQSPIDPTAPMQMHPDELKLESTHETSIQKHDDDSVIETDISTGAPRSLIQADTSLPTKSAEKSTASWQGLNISDPAVSQSDSFDQNTSTINLKDLNKSLNTDEYATEKSSVNLESVSAKKRKGPRIIIQNTKPEKSFKMRTEKVQTKHKAVADERNLTDNSFASDSTHEQSEHTHDQVQSDNSPVHVSESKQLPEYLTATPVSSKHIRIDSDSDTEPCASKTQEQSLPNKAVKPYINTIQQADKAKSAKANADVKKLVDALGASGPNSNALQEALKGFSVNTPIKFVTGDPNLLLNINKLAGNAKQVMLPGNKRGYVLAVGQSPANLSLPKAALEKLGIKGNVVQNEAIDGENKASTMNMEKGSLLSDNRATSSTNGEKVDRTSHDKEKTVVDSSNENKTTAVIKQLIGSNNSIENGKLSPDSNVEKNLSEVVSNETETIKSSKASVELKLSEKVGSNDDSITRTKISKGRNATSVATINAEKKADKKRSSKTQRMRSIEPENGPTKGKRLKSVSPSLDINDMLPEPMDEAVQDICSKHIKKSEAEKRDGLKTNKYSKRDSSENKSSKSRRSTRHKTYTKIKSPPAESEALSIEAKIEKEKSKDDKAIAGINKEPKDTLKLKLKLNLATEQEMHNIKDVHARQTDLIVEQSSVSEKIIETKKCAKDKHRRSKKNAEDSKHLEKDNVVDTKHKKDKGNVTKSHTSSNKTKEHSISNVRLSSSEERSKPKMSELDVLSSNSTKTASKASSKEKDNSSTTKITETFSESLSGAIDAKLTSLRTSSRRRHKTDSSAKSENTKISKVTTSSHKAISKSSSHKSKPLELVKSAGSANKHSTTNPSPAKPARRTITSGGIEMLVSDTDDKIVCSSCRIVMTSIVEIAKHKCSVGVVSNTGTRLDKEADVTSFATQEIPRKELESRHTHKNRSNTQTDTPHDSRSPKLRSYYSKRHSHRGNNKSTSSSKDIAATEARSATEGSLNQKKDLGPELVNMEDAELSDGCNVDIVGDGDDL